MVNYEESVGLRGCGGRDEGILSSPGSGKNDFFPATAGLRQADWNRVGYHTSPAEASRKQRTPREHSWNSDSTVG